MAYADTWDQVSEIAGGEPGEICCSSDGTKLAAINAWTGNILVSTDSGVTWSVKYTATSAYYIDCSDDFGVIIAGDYTSVLVSIDAGETWATQAPDGNPTTDVCVSGNGLICYAGADGSNIYKSTDNGATWVSLPASPMKTWDWITCDGDGSHVFAIAYGATESIYRSTDGGVTWSAINTLAEPAPPLYTRWVAIACSADGQRIYALYEGTTFYSVSGDGGNTWATFDVSGNRTNPRSVACSSSGQHAIIGGAKYDAYVTADYGVTWSTVSVAEPLSVRYDSILWVAVNGDASKNYAAVRDSFIYRTAPPLGVAGISPAFGPVSGGTPITVTGTGFSSATVATLGNLNLASHTVVNDTTITGVTPPNTAGFKTLTVHRP